MSELKTIKISDIKPNAQQPRTHFTGIDTLAESIKVSGLLEPIMVRPYGEGYQIIHGERRYRASSYAGLVEIPAIVREATDDEVFLLALVENMQRENLTPMEEARAFRTLQDQGQTQGQIAATIGKGQSYVAHKLRLLKLPDFLVYFLENQILSENHIRQIVRLKKIYAPGIESSLSEKFNTDITEKDQAILYFASIRPEGRVMVFPVKPFHLEACRLFADYVLKHNFKIPQWMVAGFWWLCMSAAFDFSVSNLTISINKFAERHQDAAAMWYFLHREGMAHGYHCQSLISAFFEDLKQSGSDNLDMADSKVVEWWDQAMMTVAKKGKFSLPTNYRQYCPYCEDGASCPDKSQTIPCKHNDIQEGDMTDGT